MSSRPQPVPAVVDDACVLGPARPGRLGLPTAETVELRTANLHPSLGCLQVESRCADLDVRVPGRFQCIDENELRVPEQVCLHVGNRSMEIVQSSPGLGAREGANVVVPLLSVPRGQIAQFGGNICRLALVTGHGKSEDGGEQRT